MRLGDRRKWGDAWLGEDGLVGFFLDGNYRRFYPASGLEAGASGSHLAYGHAPRLSVACPLELTLLLDPTRGVCVTSGILPRAHFRLPYGDSAETLEHKEVIFFTGPVLSTAAKPRMPEPSDLYGEWSWTHHPAVEVWRAEGVADTGREQGRFFAEALQIAEGWLRLVTAPFAIKGFGVKGARPEPEAAGETADGPARFPVSRGEPILLVWTLVGADEVALHEWHRPLFTSVRHPLPTQYVVMIEHETVLTLTARARPSRTAAAGEPAVLTRSIRLIPTAPMPDGCARGP